jgi:hypothetical protein
MSEHQSDTRFFPSEAASGAEPTVSLHLDIALPSLYPVSSH